jgi:hypothetical protein
MSYALERKGDEWKIKSRSMVGSHDKVQGETGLPPGHPGASAGAETPLPPGHPGAGDPSRP